MYLVTALYDPPQDPAAFDKHFDTVHVPIALTFPGLQHYSVSRPGPDQDGNPARYHLVAVLEFADAEAFGAALSGPVGQAAMADLPNFAGAGVTILTGEADVLV